MFCFKEIIKTLVDSYRAMWNLLKHAIVPSEPSNWLRRMQGAVYTAKFTALPEEFVKKFIGIQRLQLIEAKL